MPRRTARSGRRLGQTGSHRSLRRTTRTDTVVGCPGDKERVHPGVPWHHAHNGRARASLRRGEVQARLRSPGRGLSPGQPTTESVRVVRLSERCDAVCHALHGVVAGLGPVRRAAL